jgi:hypothetical protein
VTDDGLPAAVLAAEPVRVAAGWNRWQGQAYVDRDAFAELVTALAARDLVAGRRGTFSAAERLTAAAAAVGYRVAADPAPAAVADTGTDTADATPDPEASPPDDADATTASAAAPPPSGSRVPATPDAAAGPVRPLPEGQ